MSDNTYTIVRVVIVNGSSQWMQITVLHLDRDTLGMAGLY